MESSSRSGPRRRLAAFLGSRKAASQKRSHRQFRSTLQRMAQSSCQAVRTLRLQWEARRCRQTSSRHQKRSRPGLVRRDSLELMSGEPIVVNGVSLGPQSDFLGMFRRALQGETVFPSKAAFGAEDGVVDVVEATQGSALAPRVREAIMTLLIDADPRVRAGAVMALGTFPNGFDGRVLLRMLDRQPNLFRGVAPLARGYLDLECELLVAI